MEFEGVNYKEILVEDINADNDCIECDLLGVDTLDPIHLACHPEFRKDGKSVVFKIAKI